MMEQLISYGMKVRLLILVLVIGIGEARADEFDEIKQSVGRRAPELKELKEIGVIREGAGGLLEGGSVKIDPAQQKILESENADRTRLFRLIAQRCQKTSNEVADTFAQMAEIAEKKRTAAVSPSTSATATVTPTPPPIVQSTPRPKVLTRPFANIYSGPTETSQKVLENTPAFKAYFVYQKVNDWYEVGSDSHGKKVGWMRADDVVEWKQSLVVEFTHPEGRQPVLMFNDKAVLSRLVATPMASRASQVSGLYTAIKGGGLPASFPVRAMEPGRGVPRLNKESKDQFYLLPIVGFEQTEIDGREGRLLQLAAATRKRGAGPIDPLPPDTTSPAASRVNVDIVFVMDLTRSMGPFADRTLEMITECTKRFSSDQKMMEALRFGFWGYRDFPELCHGIEFNTRNYTPELQRLPDFAVTLRGVQETKVDSIDYEEDVFAGVKDGIQKTRWRSGAIHILILVGDAPGRPPGETDPWCPVPLRPKGTESKMDAESIRRLADEGQVYISALYLKTPKWARYSPVGERQFRTFSRNSSDLRPGHESFRFINALDTNLYRATAQSLTDGLLESIVAAQNRSPQPPKQDGSLSESDVNDSGVADSAGRELARKMFHGAMVEWLERKDPAQAPTDVTLWASDKDLVDPAIQSLDVQVFLTKNELNSLKLMVDQVREAVNTGKLNGEDFFQALQAVVATTVKDPEQIRNATVFAKTELVPDFLKGLPYRSTLMSMSNEIWRNMSQDAQDQFLQGVESKLRFYQEIHDTSERWQPLNEGDDQDDWVANVPLEALP
jgi:serine/threonine-protein kinase PpkA